MFLKRLSITSHERVIRDITFHKGLNLIIDETARQNEKETGNNVGKTTVLMLVDFCLGANPKHIYTDPENRAEEHKLVKDFLVDNEVIITLVLVDNFENVNAKEVKIERNFLARRRKIQRVDGFDKTDDEFEEALTGLLFPGHYDRKPTFRQIISHNIRYRDLSLNNTLKTLDRYTRDDEYETLYLFLLGCDFQQGDTKQNLRSQIRIEESFKARLEREQTRSAYETALDILEHELSVLEQRKSKLNLNENFTQELKLLNEVKYNINWISSEIARFSLRRSIIIEAEQELQAGVSNIDIPQLESIYQQAQVQLGSLHRTFQELVNFHNRMVGEKIKYVTKELPELDALIRRQNVRLENLLAQESALAKSITASVSFEELEKLIAEINDKYRKKGEYQNLLSQLRETDNNLTGLRQRLDAIDDGLFSEEFERRIKEQVSKFNRHFASISQELYGEKYALKVDPKTNSKGQRVYQFSSFNTNFSSGKKQVEITCFDIAYTLFADQEHIPCMHFLLSDKKELVHDNQLLKIASLVSSKDVQFVASILRDKLPTELDRDDYIVLKLSQADKLFRIEGTR